jgi:hypothetical protein
VDAATKSVVRCRWTLNSKWQKFCFAHEGVFAPPPSPLGQNPLALECLQVWIQRWPLLICKKNSQILTGRYWLRASHVSPGPLWRQGRPHLTHMCLSHLWNLVGFGKVCNICHCVMCSRMDRLKYRNNRFIMGTLQNCTSLDRSSRRWYFYMYSSQQPEYHCSLYCILEPFASLMYLQFLCANIAGPYLEGGKSRKKGFCTFLSWPFPL